MLPYKTLINFDRTIAVPLYIQICNAFIALIKEGILQPADAMPSSRKLATTLQINRNTANLAYEELTSQGWAESVDRKGIFVTSKLPVPSKPDLQEVNNPGGSGFTWTDKFKGLPPSINLQKAGLAIDDGFPDVRLAPIDYLMAEYRSISKRFFGKNSLKYGSPKGSDNLRNTVSRYLSVSRGVSSTAENVLITQGSQMAIYLAAQLLIEPGDVIAVGESNYQAADTAFLLCKGNLLRIPIDENGMDVDYLEDALQTTKIKGVYILPHHHCPTTVTMSMERRTKLLNLAKEHSFAVIEDDYDFEFHYDDNVYLPLASVDHNHNVIYIGSFSKTVAPSLRTGFMVGPEKFIDAAADLRKIVDRQGDTLMEEAIASLFNNGEIERHFRKSVKIYKERRNIFCNILNTEFRDFLEFETPRGGLAVWSGFDKKIDLVTMSENAAKKGLHIGNGNFYKNEVFQTNALRLGFASLEVNEMVQALEILKKTILA